MTGYTLSLTIYLGLLTRARGKDTAHYHRRPLQANDYRERVKRVDAYSSNWIGQAVTRLSYEANPKRLAEKRTMILYRVSIVERNYPKGHPQSRIIDVASERNFKSINLMRQYVKRLLKKGDDVDITIHDVSWSGEDYVGSIDPHNLQALNY